MEAEIRAFNKKEKQKAKKLEYVRKRKANLKELSKINAFDIVLRDELGEENLNLMMALEVNKPQLSYVICRL